MRYLFVSALILLTACSPGSREQYQKEGRRRAATLSKTLKEITTRDELIDKSKKIKKQINSLIDLAISAHYYEKKHPAEPLPEQSTLESDMLEYEIKRIMQIDGCTPIIEDLQKNALEKLYLEITDQKDEKTHQ